MYLVHEKLLNQEQFILKLILVEENSIDISGGKIGDTLVCRNSGVVYSIEGNPDFDYNWTLNSGGNLSTLGNSSIVTWQTTGTHEVGVYNYL